MKPTAIITGVTWQDGAYLAQLLLRKNYNNFINKNVGINQYPTDPTDPRSWGSPDDASKWFVETELSKEYFQELAISSKKINEKYI